MQINGNIVVLPVPAEKQDLAYLPDRFETGERVQTPRGSFQVTAMSREQMEAAGYGVHHVSDDGKYLIMGNGTRAFAVAAEQPEKDNPLRTAEMTLEDDYGMIDGVINNGRRGEELEKAQEDAKREYSFSVRPIGCTPAFLFVFVIIRFFRFRYTFYHVNDYGIKLCGVLRCNDRPPGILFDILSNLTGIAAATTGNLLTFRKSFRLMCF